MYFTELYAGPPGPIYEYDLATQIKQVLHNSVSNGEDMVVYNGNLIYVETNQLKQMPKDGSAPPVSVGTGFGNCQRLYAILIPNGKEDGQKPAVIARGAPQLLARIWWCTMVI